MTEGFIAYNDNNNVLVSSEVEHLHYEGKATYVSSVNRLNEVVTGYPWDTRNWANSGYYSTSHTYNSYPNVPYPWTAFISAGHYTWQDINQKSRLTEEYYKNLARTSGCCIHTYTFTSAGTPLVFIHPSDIDLFYGVVQQSQSGTTWTIKVLQSGIYSHPPDLYMFVPPSELPAPTEAYGFQTFLSSGDVAFDSRLTPLVIGDGGVSTPPTVPCDGGIPTESPFGNNYGYHNETDCGVTLYVPNQGPRLAWGYRWLDFDFKSDTTYTTSNLTTPVAPNKLMFAAPSIAQAVYRRLQHGWGVTYSQAWYLGCGYYNDNFSEAKSTSLYWAMYRNAYRIRPAASTKTRKIFYNRWVFNFSWPSDTPTGASVGDLWISLPDHWAPSFLYEWTEDSEWVPKNPADEGWSFTMSTWSGSGAMPSSPNDGDMFSKRLTTGPTWDSDNVCWRYQGGSWVNIRLNGATQIFVTDTIATGSGTTTSIESGWAILDSGHSYAASYMSYSWFGSNTATSTSFGNMPYLPKTINLSNNAFLITDIDKYT